jgi:4-hydroxybenzoate polyprenyltransferase
LTEIIVKTGFVLIGALFALNEINESSLIVLSELFLISLLSGLGIYAINSYFGYIPDRENARLENIFYISRSRFKYLALLSCLMVLIILALKSLIIFLTALGVFLFWTVYVHPKINLKGRFLGGISVAFLSQILHFHIGVFYVGAFNTTLFLISIYFAFCFMAGHIWHELIDWEADKKSKSMTTAIKLGKFNAAWLAELVFLLSAIYWGALAYFDIISVEMLLPYTLAYVVQRLFFRIYKLRNDQSPDKIEQFRKLYLSVFFIASIWILLPKINLL